MLRYFYLLCLLVCIELSFCYEFISEGGPNHRSLGKSRSGHRRKSRIRGKRHEDEDKESEALIDLASFIQQPEREYGSLDDTGLYENGYKRGTMSKDYSECDSLSEPQQLQKKNVPNSHNFDSMLNFYSGKLPGLDNLMPKGSHSEAAQAEPTSHETRENTNPLHKTQKKWTKQQMRFPFFSHKKSMTQKPKKNKKRRLLGSNRSSKPTETTSNVHKIGDSAKLLREPASEVKTKRKRASPLQYCPLCKRRIANKAKKKQGNLEKPTSSKIIHNSRQYFQEANEIKNKHKKEISKYNLDVERADSGYKESYRASDRLNRKSIKEKRRKREPDYDRERQLKELEEVQKKIDSVEITSPTYQRRIGIKLLGNAV